MTPKEASDRLWKTEYTANMNVIYYEWKSGRWSSCVFVSQLFTWALAVVMPSRSDLLWRMYDGSRWSNVGTVFEGPNLRGKGKIRSICANLDEDDEPLVLAISEVELFHPQLWQARWDGTGWTQKRVVEGVKPGRQSGLFSARNIDGTVHFIYVGPLEPRESYRIFYGTESPEKPYHGVYRAGQLTSNVPVTGRSRRDYSYSSIPIYKTMDVTIDPLGNVQLIASPRSSWFLDYLPPIVEHHTYRSGRWHQTGRISEFGYEMRRPSLAVDAEGALHVVYTYAKWRGNGEFPSRSRYSSKQAGRWLGPDPAGEAYRPS